MPIALKYKAVIFDYGEVIWMQSRNIHVYKQIEEDNNLAENSLVDTLTSSELSQILPAMFQHNLLIGQYTAEEFDEFFTKAYNKKFGTDFKKLKFFSAIEYDKDAIYEEAVLHMCLILREMGIKTALMLDTYHVDDARKGRKLPGMDKYFDYIFESCLEGVKKPDPKFFKVVLDRLDVDPSEVIFIDDAKANCNTAKSLGMNVIRVENSFDMLEDLQEMLGFELD
ncbi:hypothetical protein WR25_21766 [Diploscapter pachys]|uniref:Uncharacterized protein n=1 Tax=Diploscapter pachys TaxID=2018661 RepID=A0A2A2LFA1_9BILA|nr:hypothetical protein WR25_21766 [Diploscapter pachys]